MSSSGDTTPSVGPAGPASSRTLRSATSRKPPCKYMDLTPSNDEDLDEETSRPPVKKRKRTESKEMKAEEKKVKAEENNNSGEDLLAKVQAIGKQPKEKKEQKIKESNEGGYEKRRRGFRSKAPQSYLEKLKRAQTQRMIVLERVRGGTDDAPEETVEMAGSTGNVYHITINHEPSCTCPDNKKGNQCKHIVYVLHNVLKAPENLQYQLAFLSSELRDIFAQAPPIPSATPSAENADSEHPSNRKAVDGDCPICFIAFEPASEEIVWCKAACGNNIHKDCFEQWATSRAGAEVKCVYCRTPWQGDEESIEKVKSTGKINAEGYVNVASQLGLSGHRDFSTYHQPWVRQIFGRREH